MALLRLMETPRFMCYGLESLYYRAIQLGLSRDLCQSFLWHMWETLRDILQSQLREAQSWYYSVRIRARC